MVAPLVEFTRHDDGCVSITVDGGDAPEPHAEALEALHLPPSSRVEPIVMVPVDHELRAHALRKGVQNLEAMAVITRRLVGDKDISLQVGYGFARPPALVRCFAGSEREQLLIQALPRQRIRVDDLLGQARLPRLHG